MANAKEKKAMEEQAAKAVSLCPTDMMEGGGLLDNVRVTITAASFEMTDYGGKAQQKKPCAHLVLEEEDGTVHEDQWWSCGKAEDWCPSDDGKYLIPTGLKKQLHKSSNFGMFLQSLMDSAFPADKFDADINFLVGTEFHLQQVKAEGRDKVKAKDGSKEYDATVPCCAEIFKFPWEGKKATSGGKAKRAPAGKKVAAKPDDDGDGDLEAKALTLIMELLAESEDGTVTKKSLAPEIMKRTKAAGEKPAEGNKLLSMLWSSDDFLNREGQPWSYEDGVISSL